MLEVTGVRGFHLTSILKYNIAEKLTLGVYDTYRWLVIVYHIVNMGVICVVAV